MIQVVEKEVLDRGRMAELAAVLAFLWKRHAAAQLVAEQYPSAELVGLVADRRRQLEVLIGDLEAGFHLTDDPAPEPVKTTTMREIQE